MKVTRIF